MCLQGKATPTEEKLSARACAGTGGLSGNLMEEDEAPLLEAAEHDSMDNDEEQQ